MYEELKNTIIDTTKEEYKNFPDFLNGHIFIDYDNGFITKESAQHLNNIPQVITMRQARLQLLEVGLLDDVEALVALDRKSQIEWEYANEVYIQSPLIEAVKGALSLTDKQVDAMFLKASKL
jgi:hypothetical protein